MKSTILKSAANPAFLRSKSFALSAVLTLGLALGTFELAQAAGELDNEATVANQQVYLAKDLPATVVIRTRADKASEAEVLHTNSRLAANAKSVTGIAAKAKFVRMAETGSQTKRVKSELDADSSTSSWRFYFSSNYYNPNYSSYYYYPTYYYSGYTYNYTPYYSYSYAGYNYTYCGWNQGYWSGNTWNRWY